MRLPLTTPGHESVMSLPGLLAETPDNEIHPIVRAYAENFTLGHELGSRLVAQTIQGINKENVQLASDRDELHERLSLDPKLGILNYPTFTARAQKLINNTEALEASGRIPSFALLLLDLDNFKRINTRIGYSAADSQCLLPAAEVVKQFTKRDTDLAGELEDEKDTTTSTVFPVLYDANASAEVGRFGGEEFVMLLGGLGPRQAQKLAEQVRSAINAIIFDMDGEHHQLGVSIGLAVFPPGTPYHDAFQLANDAVAHAKTLEGKNSIVIESMHNQGANVNLPETA